MVMASNSNKKDTFMESKRVWMKVAVSNSRLRTPDDDRHWRMFIGSSVEEVPLRGIEISGAVTRTNQQTKSCIPRDETRMLAAWISLFGDLRVENNVAYIALRDPTEKEQQDEIASDPTGTISLRTMKAG
jgi:hypothetical protein